MDWTANVLEPMSLVLHFFIGYASEGAREDALMIAMTIVKPEKAQVLAGLAEDFGLALRTITAKCQLSGQAFHGNTLH